MRPEQRVLPFVLRLALHPAVAAQLDERAMSSLQVYHLDILDQFGQVGMVKWHEALGDTMTPFIQSGIDEK